MNAIGIRLRELREELGLTQQEFAEKIGTVRSTYSKYEMVEKSNMPSESVINSIAEKFGVSRDWLLDGIEPKYKSRTREEEISNMISTLIRSEDEASKAIIYAVLKMTPEHRKAVVDLAVQIAESYRK